MWRRKMRAAPSLSVAFTSMCTICFSCLTLLDFAEDSGLTVQRMWLYASSRRPPSANANMDKWPASSNYTEIPPRPLWAYQYQHIKSSQKYNVYIYHRVYFKKGTAMSQEELFLLILS